MFTFDLHIGHNFQNRQPKDAGNQVGNNLKEKLMTDNDGHKVITKAHINLWSMWAKNDEESNKNRNLWKDSIYYLILKNCFFLRRTVSQELRKHPNIKEQIPLMGKNLIKKYIYCQYNKNQYTTFYVKKKSYLNKWWDK